MSKQVKRYNDYCLLVSKLDAKNQELAELVNKKGELEYQIVTLKRQISDFKDITQMSAGELSAIKRSRIKNCLNDTVYFDGGGAVTSSPAIEFRKSSDGFKSLTSEQKKLYKNIQLMLVERQYSIQNAIVIASDGDDGFSVKESSEIEDFIDEMMRDMANYEAMPVSDLKKTKQLIYIFVEHISNQ